jgi:hypothetical protein
MGVWKAVYSFVRGILKSFARIRGLAKAFRPT